MQSHTFIWLGGGTGVYTVVDQLARWLKIPLWQAVVVIAAVGIVLSLLATLLVALR
jgi:hypothetical protein